MQREYKSVPVWICVCMCVWFKVDTVQQSDEFADITAVDLTAQRK